MDSRARQSGGYAAWRHSGRYRRTAGIQLLQSFGIQSRTHTTGHQGSPVESQTCVTGGPVCFSKLPLMGTASTAGCRPLPTLAAKANNSRIALVSCRRHASRRELPLGASGYFRWRSGAAIGFSKKEPLNDVYEPTTSASEAR
jgi:hypothetical protein